MTYEEARSVLLSEHYTYGEFETAAEMAAEAITKQIPKKPKHFEIHTREEGTCRSGYCAVCGVYSCEWEHQKGSTNYCDKCGQKIDWGYEE